jgi:hypothetical protein
LSVAAESLRQAVDALPATYTITGSSESQAANEIVLRVCSGDLAGHVGRLRLEITDAGSTRVTRIVPDVAADNRNLPTGDDAKYL